jgi:signal transduction histidine kinase
MKDNLKILLLEDDPGDAEIVQHMLNKQDWEVEYRVAMTRQGFIEALDHFHPDVILADNSLPQFNASEALEIINEREDQIPFILVTGTVSEEFAAKIIKAGADDYFLKDRLARLPSAIEAALKQRRLEKERRSALEQIQESEEQYRTLMERISDGFIVLDSEWKYKYVNKRTGEMTGRDPRSLVGKHIWEEFPEAVGSDTYHAFVKAMETKEYINNVDYYPPLQLWQENEIYPNADGLSIFLRDITERKRSEETLRNNTEQLRELSQHLQDIREEERAAMAREVHDVLGQQLTGFKMDIAWLSRKLNTSDNEIKERLTGTLQLIDDAIRTVRRIATDLRPSILDDLGLVTAMEWQSEEFEKRSGVKVYFSGTMQELDLTPNVSIALFRIYQELLTNVARHAQASAVKASLDTGNAELHLTVTDNGKGFDTENQGNKKTLGLLGIKERTLLMGGRYEFKSQPGEGTEVIVSVPLVQGGK